MLHFKGDIMANIPMLTVSGLAESGHFTAEIQLLTEIA